MAEIKIGQKPTFVTTTTRIRLTALAALGTIVASTAQAGTSDLFGWNPAALNLDGGSFVANTMLLSDFGQTS